MSLTFTVSNAAELSAAIDNATGGDRIELQGGDYGELQISNTDFGGEGITIASADPHDMAVFDKIGLYYSSNIHFDSVEIDYEPTGNTGYSIAFRSFGGDDVSLRNSILQGGYDENNPDPAEAAAPSGQGISIQQGDNIVLEDNDISEFHRGIGISYLNNVTISDNEVYDLRTTPLAGGGLNDVEISGNHFGSSAPVNLGGSGDHADMIHFYPLTNQDGPMTNIVIRDNFFEQGTNPDAILGIYLDDHGGGGSGLGYENVLIQDNILHNGDAQGVRVENVDGLRILDNTLLQSSGDSIGEAPGIVLTSDTRNVEIDNNIIAGQISGPSIDAAGALNVTVGDNLFVQNSNPHGENYVGELFVNGLTPDGDPNDFIALPGSAAEGYGAQISVFDLDPGENVAVISNVAGEHLDLHTINFDVSALYGANGEINIGNAEVTWDFGDGNTATGDAITHTYNSAGSYEVTANFALANGETISVDKTVDVFTADAVTLGFENGFVDTSDFANDIRVVDDVAIESARFGDAIRLLSEEARVEIDRTEEIIENPEFSLSFAFQKDGGTGGNSDDGALVYFSGTSVITTQEGSLSLRGSTSTGDSISLRANIDGIEDGAWHHLTYTFSSQNGTASLYLDGEEVDSAYGLTGIQHSTGGHDIHLGGRVSDGFGGLLDEFQFTRAALSADEVAERYETLFNGLPEEAEAISVSEPVVISNVAPTVAQVTADVEPQEDLDIPSPVVVSEPEPAPEVVSDAALDTIDTVVDTGSQPYVLPEPVPDDEPELELELDVAQVEEEVLPEEIIVSSQDLPDPVPVSDPAPVLEPVLDDTPQLVAEEVPDLEPIVEDSVVEEEAEEDDDDDNLMSWISNIFGSLFGVFGLGGDDDDDDTDEVAAPLQASQDFGSQEELDLFDLITPTETLAERQSDSDEDGDPYLEYDNLLA